MVTDQKKVITVREVMTSGVEMIGGLATIEDAIRMMKERKFGALIVDRRDKHDEYGLISVQNIARDVIEPNLAPERISVYEVMEKPVITFHGDMNIRYAIRLLERVGQLRALVIDNGEAVGIVTMLDMVLRYIDLHDTE